MPVVYTNSPVHPCPLCLSLKWISFALFILLVTFSYFSHLWSCAPFFRYQGYCFLLPTTSVGGWISQLGRLETRALYTSSFCVFSPHPPAALIGQIPPPRTLLNGILHSQGIDFSCQLGETELFCQCT